MAAALITTGTDALPDGPGSRWTSSDVLDLAPRPGAVAAARLRARCVLRDWRLDELADDACQIASELIANAVEAHGREGLCDPVRLALLTDDRNLLLMVRDASSGQPSPHAPGLESENGRGLMIVDALSARWDVIPLPGGGKSVRALLEGKRAT